MGLETAWKTLFLHFKILMKVVGKVQQWDDLANIAKVHISACAQLVNDLLQPCRAAPRTTYHEDVGVSWLEFLSFYSPFICPYVRKTLRKELYALRLQHRLAQLPRNKYVEILIFGPPELIFQAIIGRIVCVGVCARACVF